MTERLIEDRDHLQSQTIKRADGPVHFLKSLREQESGVATMIGMLQILTYMFAFYLVVKGIEVLQIALASARTDRKIPATIGGITLAACLVAAIGFVALQDRQASAVGAPLGGLIPDEASSQARSSYGDAPNDEDQIVYARGRDARNKGWKWAEDKKLGSDETCAQLGDPEEQVGCRAYVSTFGDRNR